MLKDEICCSKMKQAGKSGIVTIINARMIYINWEAKDSDFQQSISYCPFCGKSFV